MTLSAVPAMPGQIEQAIDKTEKVQQDLEVAGAEIGLAHDALDRHLPPDAKQGDVAWAIGQNAAVEQKLEQAAEELEEVSELLADEVEERTRLEQALEQRGRS